MKQAIIDLLSSKKFITFVTGVAGILLARWGLSLDEGTVAAMLGVLAILLGAQGAASHGKEAAQVNAAASAKTISVTKVVEPISESATAETTVVETAKEPTS